MLLKGRCLFSVTLMTMQKLEEITSCQTSADAISKRTALNSLHCTLSCLHSTAQTLYKQAYYFYRLLASPTRGEAL